MDFLGTVWILTMIIVAIVSIRSKNMLLRILGLGLLTAIIPVLLSIIYTVCRYSNNPKDLIESLQFTLECSGMAFLFVATPVVCAFILIKAVLNINVPNDLLHMYISLARTTTQRRQRREQNSLTQTEEQIVDSSLEQPPEQI